MNQTFPTQRCVQVAFVFCSHTKDVLRPQSVSEVGSYRIEADRRCKVTCADGNL